MLIPNNMQSIKDHVHHLDSTTLKPFVESKGAVLLSVVLLPMSRLCLRFVPEYEKIAESMQDSGITFAQIDFLGSGDILVPFNISIFPHFIVFQGFDNFRAYRGAIQVTDLMSYLNRFLQFPVLSTISATSLPEFKRSSNVVVVGYIAAEGDHSKGKFGLLAQRMHPEYVFGVTDDSALAKLERIDIPGIAVYKVADGEANTLPLIDDIDDMIDNLRMIARPLIVDLAHELHEGLLDMGIPFGYVFADTPEERARLRREIEPLAREYRQDIQFAIADPVSLKDIVEDLHLKISHLPAFAIREPIANLRYPMNDTRSLFEDLVKGFVQDYLGDKLQPTIKSEPIPGKLEGALVKVVGLNYHEIVMDTARDVLLIYCIAPCGPCEVFQPTLEVLAELYASNSKLKEKVTIGKVMYDVNDTPERGVRAFPTIKLFPAASKSAPETFLGHRTVDALADFICDHGTHKGDLRDSKDKQVLVEGTSAVLPEQGVCMYGDSECVATAS